MAPWRQPDTGAKITDSTPAKQWPPPRAGSEKPVLRVCTSCVAVVENPVDDVCPSCGGLLAGERRLGSEGTPRNPLRPVTDDRAQWTGYRVSDFNGERIGRVASVLVDPETQLVWLAVRIGRGGWFTLVPSQRALASGETVLVETLREDVRAAPRASTPEELVQGAFRSSIYRHYATALQPARRRS